MAFRVSKVSSGVSSSKNFLEVVEVKVKEVSKLIKAGVCTHVIAHKKTRETAQVNQYDFPTCKKHFSSYTEQRGL